MLKNLFNRLKRFRFLWYAIMVGFSYIVDVIFLSTNSFFENRWISWIISSIIVIFVAFVIDVILYLTKRSKKQLAKDTRNTINDIGRVYQIPNEENRTAMFYISDIEEEFIQKGNFSNKYAITKEMNRPVIYYSLSIKKYLNWIDFTFFHYLKNLKEKLHCDIIIAVHYNDEMRELSQANARNLNYYKALREWYVKTVKKIIGSDTIIAYEDAFYERYAKEYAGEFHQYYGYQVLNSAKELDNVDSNKEDIYKNFKRVLSNIESSFPIAQLAKKYAKSRQLYVLDRDKCLKDWQEEEVLQDIKRTYPFIIVAARTLTDKTGKKINVHSEDSVPNFTDVEEVLKEKVEKLDTAVLELMYLILSVDDFGVEISPYLPEGEVNLKKEIMRIFSTLKKKYHILPFTQWEDKI